jgi:ankyrin repeat protein
MEQSDSCIESNSLYSLNETSKKNNNVISSTKLNQKNRNNNKNIDNQNQKSSDNNSIKEEEDSLYSNSLNNTNNNDNEPPLFKAIYMQNINKIKELLEKGENPNCSLMNGITPLHLAINKKNEIIIEYLLKYKADPNIKNLIDGQTPVHYAIINN